MPPKPDRWEELPDQQRAFAIGILEEASARGMNRQTHNVLQGVARIHRDEPEEITLRVPVILIDFADNVADGEAHSQGYFNRLLFSDGVVQTGSVFDFYYENSFGEVVIAGEVVGWYRAPQNYAYYTNRQYGLGNYPRNAQRLAEDAIRAANEDTDFSRFDNDDDGIVDSPFIVHAGPGAEEDPNNVNLIWSHAWNVENLGGLDGVRFDGYTMVPEDGKIGVFSHELGHSLFGLPDLYDTRGESAGLGMWSVMAYGAWGDDGRQPVQFDGWCKSVLSWAEVVVPRWDGRYALPAAESSGRVLKLWNEGEVGEEYFLAEYRDRSGFDGALPAAGLLIYHLDERMVNNDHPWWPDNQGNLHDLIALQQADNRYDLEQFENPGDDGDPYPGQTDNRTFDAGSSPASNAYNGDSTLVAIRNIAITDTGVVADWIIGREGPPVIRQTLILHRGWNLVSLRAIPDELDVRELVAPLVAEGLLQFLKDGSGRFYVPQLGFINIPRWDVSSGYYLNLIEDAELTIEGEEIEFDRPIALHDGWQTIAYFPASQIEVERALAGLGEALIMAKDGGGRFYLPRLGFNNMERLSPGRGYLVKVESDEVLRYPEE